MQVKVILKDKGMKNALWVGRGRGLQSNGFLEVLFRVVVLTPLSLCKQSLMILPTSSSVSSRALCSCTPSHALGPDHPSLVRLRTYAVVLSSS